MKTRRGSTGKKFLALLLVALLAISPIASDLPQLAITVDAEETSATASDSVSALASTEATGDTNLADSLIGYYSFDGTLANTASLVTNAASENAGTGSATLHGGAGDTWNEEATGTENYKTGVNGKAYSFSGDSTDGDGNTSRGEGLQLDITATKAYTFSYWVNATEVSSATSQLFVAQSVQEEDGTYTTNGINIADNWFGTTFPTVRIWSDANHFTATYLDNWTTSAAEFEGEWKYITLTCDGESLVLYVDGVNQDTGETQSDFTGEAIFLGINWWDASFCGMMDELTVYESALTAYEVATLYACDGDPSAAAAKESTSDDNDDGDTSDTSTSTEEESPTNLMDSLTGYYTFDETLDNTATSVTNAASTNAVSGNATQHGGAGATWNATVTGDKSYSTDAKSGSSYEFKGNSNAEALTGTEWWKQTETGQDYTLEDGDTLTFTVNCTADLDGEAAFSVEIYDAGSHYITTGSDGNIWLAEKAANTEGNSVNGALATLGSTIISGETYSVTVARSGNDYTITYYDVTNTTTFATLSAVVTNMDTTAYVHFIAQVGTFTVINSTAGYTYTSGDGLQLDVTTTKDFSIGMWVKTYQKANFQPILYASTDGSNYMTLGTYYYNYASGGIISYNGWSFLDKNTNCSSELTDLPTDEWVYVTLTATSDGVYTLYYNGEVLSKQTISDYDSSVFTNLPIYLGINWWDASFCGLIDEVTVYESTLTASEVLALYSCDGDPEAAAEAEESGELSTAITHVSVHDPSIVKGYVKSDVTTLSSDTEIVGVKDDTYTKGIYFIFGSHAAWAYSWDLCNWTTFTNNINSDYATIFESEAKWADTGESDYTVDGNMWAPDVIWNSDYVYTYDDGTTTTGAWCMYMSINGNSWNSCICLLVSDSLYGDWTYVGSIIYSGFDGKTYTGLGTEDYYEVTGDTAVDSRYLLSKSTSYAGNENSFWNSEYGAHAIDPCVTYDENGTLWMSYGSWSGGIYLIRLDSTTGLRDMTISYDYEVDVSDPYMGYRIAQGYGASGEASYIEYYNGYYYLFTSYAGYAAAGGYNMRVYRSKHIMGPYKDESGDTAVYTGSTNNYYNDSALNSTLGMRLMSYYKWSYQTYAQVAQGHNSVYFDEDTQQFYLVYHTRTNDGTEGHSVRVHQLYVNEDGWLVTAPFEYAGETTTQTTIESSTYSADDIVGYYEVLLQDQAVDYANLAYAEPFFITLNSDGTITGDETGTWSITDGTSYITLVVGEETYKGVLLTQKVEGKSYKTITFTAVGTDSEEAIWGYQFTGTDALQMEADLISLPAQTVNGTALDLSTVSTYNTTLTWTSSDETVVDADGKVTVPDVTMVVTLTVEIANDSGSLTKSFDVTVLGKDAIDEDGTITVWSTDETFDLTNAVQGTYSFPNYFNSEIGTAGLTLYHGVSIEFTVSRTSETQCDYLASNIIGFNAGTQGGLYFTGGSYLGYNGTGGYFDANVYDAAYPYTFEDETTGWYKGTDFIGDGATIKIVILPDTYEVYVDGELAFDMDDVGTTEGVPGTNAIGEEYSIYTSVVSYLSSTATEFDLGWGSWWDGGYTGTISDITLTACASVTDTSGYIYYEDFENLAGATGADTNFTSANASDYLSVTTDDYTDWYLKFANSGESGNRGAYMLFGEAVRSLTEYTVEVDTSLTAGVLAQRSESEFVIMGTDATNYSGNNVVSSGYILKLYNAPPSTANTNDDTNQTTWYINDTETIVEIPVATWIHIKADVDVEAGTAEVTITNRETEKTLYSGTITVNGGGYLSGLYILNGRGVGTTSVDNISVTSYVTVTTGSVSTSGVTSIADLQGGGEVVTNSSVTVIAPEVENYTFVGWYSATIDSSGNVTGYDSSEGALATSLTYTFTAGKDIALAAVYRADSMATLTVMIDNLNGATYTVKVGDETVYSSLTEKFEGSYEAGTSVTLTADAGDSEAEFAYWMNGYDKIMSTDSTYTFVVVSDTTIYPVFNTAGSSDNTAIVDYVTYYGQVLLRYTYTSEGGAKDAPTTLPTRTGYKFSGWSMTQKAIVAAITEDNSTYVKVTPEYTELTETYTVNVYKYAGGTATLYDTYPKKAAGDTLTVTAPTASDDTSLTGKTFQYWAADEAGETILSYKESYMVYLSRDIDLYAIYEDSSSKGVTAVSTIVMTNRYAVEESSSDSSSTTCKIAFEATRSVLETETVLETGILFSTDGNYDSSDTLKIGAESSSNVTRYVSSSTTNDGVFTLYADVTDSTGTTVYARGYVVIKDSSGELITYYTDVIAETYNSLISAVASE